MTDTKTKTKTGEDTTEAFEKMLTEMGFVKVNEGTFSKSLLDDEKTEKVDDKKVDDTETGSLTGDNLDNVMSEGLLTIIAEGLKNGIKHADERKGDGLTEERSASIDKIAAALRFALKVGVVGHGPDHRIQNIVTAVLGVFIRGQELRFPGISKDLALALLTYPGAE